MKTKLIAMLVIGLVAALSACQDWEVVRDPCDRKKKIADWEPWTNEVNRIICAEAGLCSGDPDEGLGNVGYGFAVTQYHKGDTPCEAALKIMERHKAVTAESKQ